jgi:hypothetical protein
VARKDEMVEGQQYDRKAKREPEFEIDLNMSKSVWFKRPKVESPQYTAEDYETCKQICAGGIDIEEGDCIETDEIKIENYSSSSQKKKKVRFVENDKIESKPIKEWQIPKIERSLLIDIEIGDKKLVALFDTGSDVDLISERVVQRHKFPIKRENEVPSDIKELLEEYKDRFSDPILGVKFANLPPNAAKDRGDLNHKIPLIDENERPYFQHPRPLASIELGILKERIRDLIKLGHIQQSRSPWEAPILFVKKKDVTLRMCVDYQRLNKLTIKDVYPLPLINTMIDKLKKAQYFTKIDLDGVYHQIRVKPEDIPKTAFNCELGHYEFTVMTFGFSNTPATFQRIMNEIFHTEENSFIIVYLDDILIFSETWKEHINHIRWTLDKLREDSLFAKMKKCEWGIQEVEYLRHIIKPGQVAMDPKKIQAVKEWPIPQTVKNVQAFLGLANFYRRFVHRFSQIATPLTELTKLDKKWNWTESCQQAFEQLKTALTTAPVL